MTVEIGSEAPDFTLRDENNDEISLSQFRGRNVVLVFYPLDFSPTCTKELKELAATADKYAAAGAEVIGISVDSRWSHQAFKKAEGLQARLLADFNPKGAVARLYGVFLEDPGFANRGTFVIDKDGIVRHKVVTQPSEARDSEQYLEALAACPV